MMMKFKTQYDERLRVASESGSSVHITFEPYYDDNAVLELKPSGKVNSYLEIQSHADSVDINIILARYNAGETDVLSRVQGFYADVTGAPHTFAEALNLGIRGQRAFMELPLEIRAKFNHSYEQFMNEIGTPLFDEKISPPKTVDMNLVNEIQQNSVKEGDPVGEP